MARPAHLTTTITSLLQHHHVLSVPEIIEKLQTAGTPYNKTSVYRALTKLQKDALVCQHNFNDNTIVYELADAHHDHIVCTTCHRVEATECQLHPPTVVSGFKINHHHATLFGTCQNCQKQN